MTLNVRHYCGSCKHNIPREDGLVICRAFPLGIPQAILEYEVWHDHEINGDSGLIFEPMAPEDRGYLERVREDVERTKEDLDQWRESVLAHDGPLEREEDPEPLAKSQDLGYTEQSSHEEYIDAIMPKLFAKSNVGKIVEALTKVVTMPRFVKVAPQEVELVYESFLTIMTDPEGWSRRELMDRLQSTFPDMTDYEAERIARTESTKIANKARELQFTDQERAGEVQLYQWVGPQDHRTTPICTEIKERQGDGKPLQELRDLVNEVSAKHRMKYVGDWCPHPNCRHTIVEVYDYD